MFRSSVKPCSALRVLKHKSTATCWGRSVQRSAHPRSAWSKAPGLSQHSARQRDLFPFDQLRCRGGLNVTCTGWERRRWRWVPSLYPELGLASIKAQQQRPHKSPTESLDFVESSARSEKSANYFLFVQKVFSYRCSVLATSRCTCPPV